jgi:hypothetical protein
MSDYSFAYYAMIYEATDASANGQWLVDFSLQQIETI